jgi:hypothetical protein
VTPVAGLRPGLYLKKQSLNKEKVQGNAWNILFLLASCQQTYVT